MKVFRSAGVSPAIFLIPTCCKKAGETPALQCPNLTRDIAEHIVLRADKVEAGNLAEQMLSASGRRMSLDVQEARKRNE